MAVATPKPRAADMPTRKPVKLPGPVVTTTRPRSANVTPDCCITRARSGISASAWPRAMATLSLAITLSSAVSNTAAEQAASAVSIASTRMKDQTMLIRRGAPDITRSYGPDFGDVRNEMTQQILDAVLQRCRRGRATRAGALHGEKDDAVLETAESDVAAVIGDRRAHPGFDQFLDRGDGFGVGCIEEFVAIVVAAAAGVQERRA